MKKNRIITILALAGAALVLAACTARIDVIPPAPHSYDVITSWETSDGKELAACDNRETVLQYSFRIDRASRISSIRETYTGALTNDQKRRTVRMNDGAVEVDHTGGTDVVTVTHTFRKDSGFLPMSLASGISPEAIVVRPKPAPPKEVATGAARFSVTVEYGADSRKSFGTDTIHIFANCSG